MFFSFSRYCAHMEERIRRKGSFTSKGNRPRIDASHKGVRQESGAPPALTEIDFIRYGVGVLIQYLKQNGRTTMTELLSKHGITTSNTNRREVTRVLEAQGIVGKMETIEHCDGSRFGKEKVFDLSQNSTSDEEE